MKYALAAVVTAGIALGSVAWAQDAKKLVEARQGQMQLIALNLGVIGGMAKGSIEYNADAAQRAADSLVGISMIDQTLLWIDGTDNGTMADTKALPAIWEDSSGFEADWVAFVEGAAGLAAVAGNGQEALGPALGKLGGSCKSCHTDFRAK